MKTISTLVLAISIGIQLTAQTFTVGSTNADYIIDGSDDQIEIQAAIDAAVSNGGGTVQLQAGIFNLSSKIIPKSGVALMGMGIESTVLKSSHGFDYVIFNKQTTLTNFHLSRLTIDPSNAQNASGVRFNYATHCTVRSVKFINVSCNGWHLVLGIHGDEPEILQNDFSRDLLVEDCEFDGHQGSLEMLLVFNTKNTIIRNCTFKNKTKGCPNDGNGPVLGLWQQTDSILIENCQFIDNNSSEAFYYSSSSFNTVLKECSFNNTGSLKGANDSDWDQINTLYPSPKNLKITNCTFLGGANDAVRMAIQLGRIQGVLIKDCSIEGYESGITFQGGNLSAVNERMGPKYWAVINTTIKNVNPNNNVHDLHGGCLFTEGGMMHGFFICGKIFDDQIEQTMRHPLIFETPDPNIYPDQTYDNIWVLGTELIPGEHGAQLRFNGPAKQGMDLIFEDCAVADPPSFCSVCDTPQSMSTYTELMEEHDVVTAQKMKALEELEILFSSCMLSNFVEIVEGNLLGGLYTANEVKTVGTVEVNAPTTFKATECITLSEGFIATSGIEFSAIIDVCDNETAIQPFSSVDNSKLIVSLNLNQNNDTVFDLHVFPNPAKNNLSIQYDLPSRTEVSIQLINIFGQRVQSFLINEEQDHGPHHYHLTRANLPSGTYFLVLQAGTIRVIRKLTLY